MKSQNKNETRIQLLPKLTDDVFIIPEHMKEGICQREQDIKNGDYLTMDEFEKRYEKYIK
jgi:hypothetical protein